MRFTADRPRIPAACTRALTTGPCPDIAGAYLSMLDLWANLWMQRPITVSVSVQN